MLILTIRTDKPEAELGLFDGGEQLAYATWPAHRQMAETIHQKISDLLKSARKDLKDVSGVVVFRGPGSFTGLRIGISVANALADSLNIPVVGEQDDNWIKKGAAQITAGRNDEIILPEYGAPPRVTQPKH